MNKEFILNPATGEKIGEVFFSDTNEVNRILAAAQTAFVHWSATTPLKRARVLFHFKQLLEKNIDELAAIITKEHGKVLGDAKGEVWRAIELVEHCCGMPNLMKGTFSEEVGSGVDCYTVRQPLGVCVGVTPFNFPVMISTWMLAPAIACGNAFILKPSEKNPSACLFLADLLKQAGLPEGVLSIVNGAKKVVEQLITADNVKAVSCVGSTPVAKSIYETAIKQGKRAHTFGGAKNHAVIMPDADKEEVADALVAAAYGAAGERCMAISVAVAITDEVGDQLVEKIMARLPKIKIGPGIATGSEMGPLISKAHKARVASYIALGEKEGATLLADGRGFQLSGYENGFFMGPSLFDHVTPEMRIYQEEIFGPVLCVMRQPDLKQAIHLINQHSFGNGAAIFTQDGASARQFSQTVQVGMVGINVPIPVPAAYHNFGGWKQSCFGDTGMHGLESMHFYTKSKSVTTRWPKNKKMALNYHMPVN